MNKCIIGSALAAIIVSLAFVNTPLAHAATTRFSIPLSRTFFVPCANNGLGEFITVSGTEYFLVIDNDNNNNGKFQEQFRITAVGQTTGDIYQATGLLEETFTGRGFTENNNFFLIGQGTGSKLLFHETSVFTVNSDGTVTANIDNVGIDACG